MTLDLTIAIPVKNESKNIVDCLDAIGPGFASNVVVIDSGSTDGTAELAKERGVEVVQFVWNGAFPKKRNWFLQKCTPPTTWVLFLDADEILTESFKAELTATLPRSSKCAYWLRYTIHFLGRELRYGYPLDKLALFRVGMAEYERIDEASWSKLDMEIHEHPVVTGEVGRIRSKIEHRDNREITHYIEKHNEYSSWEANRFLSTFSAGSKTPMTLRQRLKYSLIRSPFSGPVYFFGAYFILGGFLDGSRGLAFATLKAAYFTQVYCKVREKEQKLEMR